MTRKLKTAALAMALVLGMMAPTTAKAALIFAIDCTYIDAQGNCNGGDPDFLNNLNRTREQLLDEVCDAYPQPVSSACQTSVAPMGLHNLNLLDGIWYIKLVNVPITHSGHAVTAYHAKQNYLGFGYPYAVVTTYGQSKATVAANVSRMMIEMTTDPFLSNPSLEICGGDQNPATYQRSYESTVYGIAAVNPVTAPVCNFEIGNSNYCVTHSGAC